MAELTMKLVFVVSPLSTQLLGERAKTGYLGIMIMWATCLSADCCKRIGLVQSTLHMKIYMTGQEKGDLLIHVTA
jgi:hypothetical protein